MINLTQTEQEQLLQLARRGLEAAAQKLSLPELDLARYSDLLQQPGASFVTLTIKGSLRGCIGSLNASRPLAEDVLQHGMDAAQDYRFPPVRPGELPSIHIEVSVLTKPVQLEYDGPEELLEQLEPGRDGVVLQSGHQRATFLPQVWEKVPDKTQFLQLLCQKALLDPDAWKNDGITIQTYQVVHVNE